jgi:hypothetical protein
MRPCDDKAVCDEPRIMQMVAVISKNIPIVRNNKTFGVTRCLRCSEIIAIEYETKATFTMVVPAIRIEFIRKLLS